MGEWGLEDLEDEGWRDHAIVVADWRPDAAGAAGSGSGSGSGEIAETVGGVAQPW